MTRRLLSGALASLFPLALSLQAQAQEQPPVQPQQPPVQQPPQGYPPPQQQPPQGYPQQQPPQGYPQQPPQYPPQQQPPQGYPQQPPQYPPQQQPPPQGYPQQQPPQGYPQQPPQYPPQQQPGPQTYPQQQQLPPQPLPPQQPPPQQFAPQQPPPPPPVDDGRRGNGEMVFMYGAGIGYGLGTGIWLDLLTKTSDPGLAILAPLIGAAAVPAGMAIWDNVGKIHRAVPASIGTGLILGAMEGIAISGTQAQLAGSGNSWTAAGYSSLVWATTTVGGVGGYLFGEFAQPDPRSMGFITSGAGWGGIIGSFFGAGATGTCGDCLWDGAAIGGLIMTNVGIVATGAASVAGYVPSTTTLKWQWVGFGAGMLVTTPIYIAYAFSDASPKHGLVANAIGGLVGVGLATILTYDKKEDSATKSAGWTPPFQLSLNPVKGGATVGASGQW